MGAIFDHTGTYRYTLWREWGMAPRVVFVMLNPSRADAEHNDPTIRRCIGLAQAWGFGALEVVNLFAYCATHPTQLRQATDPVGQDNDHYLLQAVKQGDRTVLAWGNWGVLQQRDQWALSLLAQYTPLYCLGLNQSGQPRHPLYVRRDVSLILMQKN